MADLVYPTVFILAPPFISHFRPLVALGRSLADLGTAVTIGCTPEFRDDIESQGLRFAEVTINRNKNRGVATETDQASEEQKRLDEFLEATRSGPIETLITQAHHRTDDMLANPEELVARIREIAGTDNPSLWIVDQLSYGATLALYGMDEPFATFCAPHPTSIPREDAVHTVPPSWPQALSPSPSDLARLTAVARDVERSFTLKFNAILERHFGKPPVRSAFGLVSPRTVLFNYPPFTPGSAPRSERVIFAGHTYQDEVLPDELRTRAATGSPRILIALGTFLSAREDVLRALVSGVSSLRPESTLFVGAGGSTESLVALRSDRVTIERFIPQRALLPHVDYVIHHGGVSSFTESLFTGKPMIVLPFSSDQFSVARDVEDLNLGVVLDPNHLRVDDLDAALVRLGSPEVRAAVSHWSSVVRARGPAYAAGELQRGGKP